MDKKDNKDPEIILNIQYLKNLSFKNTRAPEIYLLDYGIPKVNVEIDVNATEIQNDTFELEIVANIIADFDDKAMFEFELTYAGVFVIKNMERNIVQETLFVYCPNLLFPFLRRIVANVVMDANFPPILIRIINFEEIYKSKTSNVERIKFR